MKKLALALAAGFGLSACGISLPGSIDKSKADAPEPAQERALASYLHDLSPVIDGVSLDTARLEHVSIPVTGAVLDGWIRRPDIDDKVPVVIVFTPYYGGGDPTSPANVLGDPSSSFAAHLLPRGYAVGHVSVAGTGNSTNCFHDGGEVERKQLGEAVEYLASQPWSNGSVAAIGVSYDGTTANELFVEAPPALKTVVPMEAISDYYRYTFNTGGIGRSDTAGFTGYYYPLVGLSPAGLEGGVGPTDPANFVMELAGEACPEQLAIQAEGAQTQVTADKTAYWHERDAIELVENSLDKPRPSMFIVHGYQDANVDTQMLDGWIETVKKTGVPMHLWLGQWVHAYPESSACAAGQPCRADFFEVTLLAWFDQFLKGRDTGILDAPMMQSQADDGVWRHEDVWPPKVSALMLYPQADGALGAQAGSGTASYRDIAPNHYNESNTGVGVPLPQVPGTSVEFVSEPLSEELRFTGIPRMQVSASSDMLRGDVVATVMERFPDGTQRYLNFGALNLNHSASLDAGDTDISGQQRSGAFNLYPQDNVVSAGSRLVLRLGADIERTRVENGNSANFLNYGMNLLPLAIGSTITLDLAGISLELPVNAGERLEPITW